MFDKDAFHELIKERGKTLKEIADFLEIDVSTLYRKSYGISDFTRDEIQKLCKYLSIKNPMDIFFKEDSA